MARIGLIVTDDQKKWLDDKSEQTGESIATIIRQMIDKDKKENNVKK